MFSLPVVIPVIIEINEKGYGFIRRLDYEFSKTKNDPFLFS